MRTPLQPKKKSASIEVYGFVGWVTSFVLFGSLRFVLSKLTLC
jgi:hypothetical protein